MKFQPGDTAKMRGVLYGTDEHFDDAVVFGQYLFHVPGSLTPNWVCECMTRKGRIVDCLERDLRPRTGVPEAVRSIFE